MQVKLSRKKFFYTIFYLLCKLSSIDLSCSPLFAHSHPLTLISPLPDKSYRLLLQGNVDYPESQK